MRINKLPVIIIAAIIAIAGAVVAVKMRDKKSSADMMIGLSPVIGSIRTVISCTGTVLPKNRLEIKPPVNGRIESLLVQEGEKVKTGQILAWMSSTERAALLDAARGKGEESLKYWEQTYKPIPLSAPIDGDVIVAVIQPGQTVTALDAVVVLSDRLIVRAQVDETDIGKITPDKKAIISLDAYPDIKIQASVTHIYYESRTVNNVTMYEVDLIPQEIPRSFRSGMNATVDFIDQSKDNAFLLPLEAVQKDKDESYCMVKSGSGELIRTRVTTGISDDKNVEILSGLGRDDIVMIKGKKYSLPKNSAGTNPFMPARRH